MARSWISHRGLNDTAQDGVREGLNGTAATVTGVALDTMPRDAASPPHADVVAGSDDEGRVACDELDECGRLPGHRNGEEGDLIIVEFAVG